MPPLASMGFQALAALGDMSEEDFIPVKGKKKNRSAAPAPAPAPVPSAASKSAAGSASVQNGAQRAIHGGAAPAAQQHSPTRPQYANEPRPESYYRAYIRCFKEASGDVVLRFHKTDIVKVKPSGDIHLTTGGYFTFTTLCSMNDALQYVEIKVVTNGEVKNPRNWSVQYISGPTVSYSDGMVLKARGVQDRDRGAELLDGMLMLLENTPGTPYEQAKTAKQAKDAARAPAAAAADAAKRAPSVESKPVAPPPAAVTAVTNAKGDGAAKVGAWGKGGNLAAKLLQDNAAAAVTAVAFKATETVTDTESSNASSPVGISQVNSTDAPSSVDQAPALQALPSPAIENLFINLDRENSHVDDNTLCIVCMMNPHDTILIPCSHICLCRSCADTVVNLTDGSSAECPMCRVPVDLVLEL